MGQGLSTKVCQIAAQAFSIPLEDVYVNDTSSDKVANTQPTAASMSTDMYGKHLPQ
jgi:xanthine dehydrogenase/oxidase